MGTNAKTPVKRNRKRKHWVFCLEGDWWGVTDKTTVEPALALLKANGTLAFDYIHRDVGVVEELDYYLQKWVQRGLARYPILYLGFHGERGTIRVGDGRRGAGNVGLDELAAKLEGKCKGKLIHFGSCGTLVVNGHQLNRFLRRTGALAVCGYKADTDWFASMAFEILLLAELQAVSWDRRGMAAVQRRIKKQTSGLARALEFRLVVSSLR